MTYLHIVREVEINANNVCAMCTVHVFMNVYEGLRYDISKSTFDNYGSFIHLQKKYHLNKSLSLVIKAAFVTFKICLLK